jgi:hypothetical protein
VLELVAGRVLAVLGELDRQAVERGAVQPVQDALDDAPRDERQPLDALQQRGIEQGMWVLVAHGDAACARRVTGSELRVASSEFREA